MTEKQTSLLERETQIHLGNSINSRMFRHFQAEFDRVYFREGDRYENYDPGYNNDEIDNPHDTQATHSTATRKRIYGRNDDVIDAITYGNYRKVSRKHHGAFNFESCPLRSIFEPKLNVKIKTNAISEEEIERDLRELYPQGWKSETQKEAVMSILVKRIPRLACIMSTGAGKTLLILLSAKLMMKRGKTSIVLTPYVPLANALVNECRKLNISCIKWTPGTVERAAIVVVVTDTGTQNEFVEYIHGLFKRDFLALSFIDECHTIQKESDFRYKFERFKYLNIPGSWIFLTATLPPSQVENFKAVNNIINPPLEILRTSTNRINARYSVQLVSDGNLIEKSIKIVSEEATKLQSLRQKIIVFARSLKDIKAWTDRMICAAYDAKRPDKEAQLAMFRNGECQVLITTNALGAGMGFENVGAVFHLE